MQPETFFTTDLGNKIRLSKDGEELALRRASSITDTKKHGTNSLNSYRQSDFNNFQFFSLLDAV
jgi:hypothetical protein